MRAFNNYTVHRGTNRAGFTPRGGEKFANNSMNLGLPQTRLIS